MTDCKGELLAKAEECPGAAAMGYHVQNSDRVGSAAIVQCVAENNGSEIWDECPLCQGRGW